MIRGFFRLIGLLLLAGGFIFVVYDGARWIFVPAPRDLPRYLGQWRPPVGRRTRAALGKIKRRILR